MSWESRYDNHAEMIHLAETAVMVADAIPDVRYGRAAIHDLRGRARAYLANGWSASNELQKAERCFGAAETELAKGTGDRLERAVLLTLKTSMLERQRNYEGALAASDRAIHLLTQLEQPRMLGKALSFKAGVLIEQEKPEEAVGLLEQSLRLLEGDSDQRFLIACHYNLAVALYLAGRLAEALVRLSAIRPLWAALGDRINQYRLLHFEGDIAATLEDFVLAEDRFLEAREGLLANNVDWEAAEVSLKMAQVYLRQGKMTACRELAEQLLPIFQSRALHTEAVAALLLVREAMLAETITVHMVQETIDFLQRLRPSA
jgi:tetratricopeptide (TPR) repeat protein